MKVEGMNVTLKATPGKFYHGVYPGTEDGLEQAITPEALEKYEKAAGREAAWVYFSHNWYQGRTFPVDNVRWIHECGRVPFIRLMLRSAANNPRPDPTYRLDRIVRGDFDVPLRDWGTAAAAFGAPMLVEWGTEMNNDQFGWSAKFNGGPPMGLRLFRESFGRIVNVIRDQGGAKNITWVFHVDAVEELEAGPNSFESYYPGQDVVDWVALSVYGAQAVNEDCPPIADRLLATCKRLAEVAPGKPIVIAEFGTAHNSKRCAGLTKWTESAFDAILRADVPFPVCGFSWWNEKFGENGEPANMRVEEGPGAFKQLFRQKLSDKARILERIPF